MFKFITFLKNRIVYSSRTNYSKLKITFILKHKNCFNYVFIRNTLFLYHYRLKVYHLSNINILFNVCL